MSSTQGCVDLLSMESNRDPDRQSESLWEDVVEIERTARWLGAHLAKEPDAPNLARVLLATLIELRRDLLGSMSRLDA